MEAIIIIIVVMILIGVVSNFIDSVKRKKIEKETAEKLGPILEKALAIINTADIEEFEKRIKTLEDNFTNELVILENEEGKPINICPKCGDTLTAKDTAWHGRIFGCPNYPNCHYFVKVKEIKTGTFYRLNVRGLE